MQNSIAALAHRGYSIRQIARDLGINRRSVRRYYPPELLAQTAPPKCTTPPPEVPTGLEAVSAPKCTTPPPEVPTGSEAVPAPKCTTPPPEAPTGSEAVSAPKCTASPPKLPAGSRSQCERFREAIVGMIAQGLSAERIWQDLRLGTGLTASYCSVRRFVSRLRLTLPQPVYRLECEPGEELQVDFMQGPLLPVNDITATSTKRVRCWILRAVLSHSRKGYSEAVMRQDSETFIRALENALRAFGGVPALLSLDNLKAAVTKAHWHDPELNPKFAEFCRHYDITPMPCRPYTPEHKGKVERSVRYVRDNALAGHEFPNLQKLNEHLCQWEATVADTRIHGTTKQQVGERFRTAEKPALKPLPVEIFPAYSEAKRRVNRDGYVEMAKAYYQAPPEHIGRDVWVQLNGREVRILSLQLEVIGTHIQLEPGRYSQVRGVRGLDHGGDLGKTQRYWQCRAESIGPAAAAWAKQELARRGAAATRSIMALCHLHPQHQAESINEACAQAMAAHSGSGSIPLRMISNRLKHPQPEQQLMPSIIPVQVRPLGNYDDFIQQQTHDQRSA